MKEQDRRIAEKAFMSVETRPWLKHRGSHYQANVWPYSQSLALYTEHNALFLSSASCSTRICTSLLLLLLLLLLSSSSSPPSCLSNQQQLTSPHPQLLLRNRCEMIYMLSVKLSNVLSLSGPGKK